MFILQLQQGKSITTKISNREIIEPTAIEKVYKTATSDNDWDLSLFTCTKAGVARVLVRCQLIDVKN